MNDEEKKKDASPNPYAMVALYCGGASFLIVGTALGILHTVTDGGMFAIALMALAPAVLGIGVAYFMSKPPRG